MTSWRTRLGYGIGGAMFSVKEGSYGVFVILFYTQVLGLSGTASGIVLAIAVLFDCLSDPVIGAWSDRLHSRWGRRHPFLVAGTLPMGLGFLGLFTVPDQVIADQTLLALWLLFWSVWIRTALSLFSIPHLALSAEITQDYRERSTVIGARLFFVFLGSVLIPSLALVLLFQQSGDSDGRFVADNYAVYGLCCCILAWVIGVVSVWSTRNFARATAQQQAADTLGLAAFLRDFLSTLRLNNFRQLLVFEVAASVSYGVLIATHMLASVYFWELDSQQIALLLALPSIIGVSLAMLSIKTLSRWFAKHSVLRLSCGLLIIDAVWPYIARFAGWLPGNESPVVFWCLLLQMMIWMYLFILRAIASQSLTADIADENDLLQGRRQEGALFAAVNFTQKLATAIGPLYAGLVLDLIGLQRGMAPGTVEQPILNSLAIYCGLGVVAPLLIALYFSFRVSLSEGRLAEIQKALKER